MAGEALNRLNPRSIARQVNHKATLPQRLARELRWIWRDLQDLRAELTRWTDGLVAGPPDPKRQPQPETTDPRDVSHRGF